MLGDSRNQMPAAIGSELGSKTPLSARLSDSVAPDVQTISRGIRPDERRDLPPRFGDRFFRRPAERMASATPRSHKRRSENGSIASTTRGSGFVVALLSR